MNNAQKAQYRIEDNATIAYRMLNEELHFFPHDVMERNTSEILGLSEWVTVIDDDSDELALTLRMPFMITHDGAPVIKLFILSFLKHKGVGTFDLPVYGVSYQDLEYLTGSLEAAGTLCNVIMSIHLGLDDAPDSRLIRIQTAE